MYIETILTLILLLAAGIKSVSVELADKVSHFQGLADVSSDHTVLTSEVPFEPLVEPTIPPKTITLADWKLSQSCPVNCGSLTFVVWISELLFEVSNSHTSLYIVVSHLEMPSFVQTPLLVWLMRFYAYNVRRGQVSTTI